MQMTTPDDKVINHSSKKQKPGEEKIDSYEISGVINDTDTVHPDQNKAANRIG